MVSKRIVFAGVVVLSLVLFLSAFGFAQEDPDLAPVDVGATVGNEAPVIISMSTPNGGNSIIPNSKSLLIDTDVGVSFIAEDLNDDINIGSAAGTYTGNLGTREFGPVALTCGEALTCTNCGAEQVNISCTFPMKYYHDSGDWNIYVEIGDGVSTAQCGVGASVACTSFVYGQIKELIDPSPAIINFAVTLGATNQEATGDPLILFNGGNQDFTIGVTAYDLIGETTPGDVILTTMFSSGRDTGLAQECGDDVDSKELLGHGIPTPAITNVLVTYGDGIGNSDNDDINFCLYKAVTGISDQLYSPSTNWQVLAE